MKKAVYLLLALFREVTALYRSGNPNMHPKPEVKTQTCATQLFYIYIYIYTVSHRREYSAHIFVHILLYLFM